MSANRIRNKKFEFWVTEQEHEYIQKKARETELSVSEYLRTIAIDGLIFKQDLQRLDSVCYEMNKIGVLINQMAKKTNLENEISYIELEELNKKVGDIWQLLKFALSEKT